jgi:hypothetical protein
MCCLCRNVPHRQVPSLAMVLVAVFAVLGGPTAQAEQYFQLNSETTFHFASPEKGRQLLSRRDTFLSSLSRFDREIRVRSVGATHQQVLEAIQNDVVAWGDRQVARYLRILATLRPKLARFDLPWPAEIWLVRARGDMESGAAYCRQEAIVIPEPMDRRSEEELERLLTHELFHILSNQNPKLREQLYEIVGFERMDPLQLPAPLADRQITNPDAPVIDCFLWVVAQGEVHPAAPVLLARHAYQPDGPQSLFALLEFHLVVLEPHDLDNGPPSDLPAYQVRESDGKPWLLSPDRACLFWNIGINTNYIIHPEEVLADNFVYLIHARTDLPTPRIVNNLRNLFAKPETADR